MTKTRNLLNVHNTYYTIASADPTLLDRARDSIVHPFMVPLIEAIQHKRPQWEFEATGFGDRSTDGLVRHSTFDIYDNGEKLGTIHREYKGSGTVYAARSHRIAAKRQVGTSKMSKHLKTIVSEVLKECYPLTINELAAEKYRKSFQAMQQATYKDKRAHMNSIDIMRDSMLAYLTSGDRWAEFEAAADKPSIMQAKSTYHTLAENARVASDIAVAHHILLIERPRDIVIKPFDGVAHSTSLDGLSDHIKTSLALLKMTEVDTIVEGVGIRTADDTFYIITEKEV